MFNLNIHCEFREQAAEEEEDDDEGIATDVNDIAPDVAGAPENKNEEEKEEEDELAEYGLDKYDEEEDGEGA